MSIPGSELLFEQVGVPLLLLDATDIVERANGHAQELFGGSLVGRSASSLLANPTEWALVTELGEHETTLQAAQLPVRATLRLVVSDGGHLLTLLLHEVRDLLAGLHPILGAGGDLAYLFGRLTPFLQDRLPYDRCSLAIWHDDESRFEVHSHHPDDPAADQRGVAMKLEDVLWLHDLRSHQEPVVRKLPQEARERMVSLTGQPIGAMVHLPLHYQQRYLGALNLGRTGDAGFNAREAELVRAMIGPLALAIAVTQLIRNLRTSEQKYRMLYEEAPLMYHTIDSAGRIVDVNRREAEMLGYTKEEVIGRPLIELMSARSRAAFLNSLEEIRSERPSEYTADREFVRKDGSLLHANLNATLAYDADGQFTGARVIVRDVTEQKQMQHRLLQAQKLESLGTMLAGITHEFNNLLGPILGYAQLLQRRIGDEASKELKQIEQAAQKAKTILSSLLRFTRQSTPSKRYQDLRSLLEATLTLFESRARVERLKTELIVPPDLPWTRVDENQLTQLFLNLFNNAAEAIGDAGGTIRITAAQSGSWIRIRVMDSGGGIDPKVLPALFDPFFTTKEPGKGTGLGLATCFGIMADHGGSIQASNVDLDGQRGACFEILLPIRRRPTIGVKRPSSLSLPQAQELDLTDQRALIVEDDVRYNMMICQLLESRGALVQSALDGRQASRILARGEPWQLIVADIRMPEMDGPGLREWVAAQRPELLERMLFVTGDTMDERTARFVHTEGVVALSKPFEVSDFLKAIRHIQAAADDAD